MSEVIQLREVEWRQLGPDLLLTARVVCRLKTPSFELVGVERSLATGIRKLVTCLSMFTGIVEEAGTVEAIQPTQKSIQLTVRARTIGRGLKLGASVAVNGCCLTVVKLAPRGKDRLIQFDLLQESWRLTNLQFAKVGSLVNLERPLRADGELGGHFVTGHVDGVGRITMGTRGPAIMCSTSPRRRR